MRSSSIAARTKQLRREIELIQQEERQYRSHSTHSLAEKAGHDNRERRLVTIRDAFRTLLDTAKQPKTIKRDAIHADGGGPLRPLTTCPECGVHLREDRLLERYQFSALVCALACITIAGRLAMFSGEGL